MAHHCLVFLAARSTYRKLAQQVLAKLELGEDWTAEVPLPGGDFPVDGVGALVNGLLADFTFLDPKWAVRLVRAYGTEAREWLSDATVATDLGKDFGATLTEAELRWMMTREFAVTAEDAVWRRTKLGLRLDKAQIAAIDAWMGTEGQKS